VADAVAAAVAHAGPATSAAPVTLSRNDLFGAARKQSGHALTTLATRIEPVHRWDDLVVPEATLQQLRELCQRVIHRERVMGTWGFGESLSRGKGINALFSGGSGTGKTMAAEIVAGELGLHVFRTELAGLVSKYIGKPRRTWTRSSTRPNGPTASCSSTRPMPSSASGPGERLATGTRIWRSATCCSGWSNTMASRSGHGLRSNLDQAFVRRLAPSTSPCRQASRREIWNKVWPRQVPLARTSI
jgi:hypothetical protein